MIIIIIIIILIVIIITIRSDDSQVRPWVLHLVEQVALKTSAALIS